MAHTECVEFLRWALPRMGLRWEGYRRVRRQVCRRIGRRTQELHLASVREYRHHIEMNPAEWETLDSLCHISISRFFRDGAVFQRLADEILPSLAADAISRKMLALRCWSAGCASGEEPYSLSILWSMKVASRFPSLELSVLATDVDQQLLMRARHGRYARSSLREVPFTWVDRAFERTDGLYVIRGDYRDPIEFRCEDVRADLPKGQFDLILCRNLVFTYFNEEAQMNALRGMLSVLRTGGAFVTGSNEKLPPETSGLSLWRPEVGIYRRT